MSIPAFLRSRTLALAAAPEELPMLGVGGVQETGRIGFSIIAQEQRNWCWSAVSVSIERFYDSGAARQQCELANTALARNDCCADGASDSLTARFERVCGLA